MKQIERYIFRIALGAFLSCLIGLTGVIWVTQALRELDLITAKGQTLLIFFLITGLSLPTLITVIAPVALFIAVVYALNKLNGDSELIVMSAAGMSPRHLMRPFLTLALIVSAAIGFLTIQVMPSSFQELRDVLTRVRGDFIANVVKEGQFTTLDSGITFHFRERAPNGALLGIFMQDRREAGKMVVYLAERGQAVDLDGQTYLVLEKGSIHRQQPGSRDSSIITFQRYAVDLAAFTPPDADTIYKPRERSTVQLMFPDANETYYKLTKGRFRAELHDRLSSWLYPLGARADRLRGAGRSPHHPPGPRARGRRRHRRRGGPAHRGLCRRERGGAQPGRGGGGLCRAARGDRPVPPRRHPGQPGAGVQCRGRGALRRLSGSVPVLRTKAG